MKFTCSKCGDQHDLDELSFGIDYPLQWTLLNEQEKSLSDLGSDQCVIQSSEGTSYYIRACLEIPVIGRQNAFVFGVWCSLSENSMHEMCDYWHDPIRVHKGPYFGWLCTIIPGYPDTAFMKTMVHQKAVGHRPFVVLEPTSHPLSLDQTNGISQARLKDIVVNCLHGSG